MDGKPHPESTCRDSFHLKIHLEAEPSSAVRAAKKEVRGMTGNQAPLADRPGDGSSPQPEQSGRPITEQPMSLDNINCLLLILAHHSAK